MKPVSLLFFSAAVWECIRFSLVLAYLFTIGMLPSSRALLVWFSSPQLILAAAFVLIGVSPQRYGTYRAIIVLGKGLSVLAGTIALGVTARSAIDFPVEQSSPLMIAVIIGVDILVLAAFIITTWSHNEKQEPAAQTEAAQCE
ncbi:MAG: hypothetical protein EA383_01730 [Spirochaetaceae bacterium]|nr:MAG: hypothetical protein EA383_01730 [Spirochaetaceae bacterium]